jgi:hypothetical protein
MMEIYAETVGKQVLLFKEPLWDLFDDSESKAEAYGKRDALAQEEWWRPSWQFTKFVEFLLSKKIARMVTYLEHPEIPRYGHRETLMNVWQQMQTSPEASRPLRVASTTLSCSNSSSIVGEKNLN